ncbi:hypothetical protein [Streptomyces sp. NBC_00091]|uniref:hypothetical protein n=1 Tax=Streptomyces sp. NBC_00091 TaxID=2975648 RepID=UPI00225BA7FA|nr:hypothetical protein [Streptomyces sp. NBC_00091]MCX5377326.1 hypothetical protein [Streptomyces sp. NBC_00091]
MRRWWAAAALVLTPALLATGCDQASGSPRSAPASTGPALVPPAGDVRQAYDTYWADLLAAGQRADPEDPALARSTTGAQLDNMRGMLRRFSEAGQVVRGDVGHRIDGMEITGARSRVLQDCVDLDRWLIYDRASGAPTDQLRDKPSQLSSFTLVTERLGEPWKVTSVVVLGEC